MIKPKIIRVESNDPKRIEKVKNIEGANRLCEMFNSVNRDIENQLLLVSSIILSGILGALLSNSKYLESLILFEFILIIFLFFVIKQENDKKQILDTLKELIEMSKKIGLDLASAFRHSSY